MNEKNKRKKLIIKTKNGETIEFKQGSDFNYFKRWNWKVLKSGKIVPVKKVKE